MYLGIEIGGTKLQLGVGPGDGQPLAEVVRTQVDPSAGAAGIRAFIASAGAELLSRHDVRSIGVGFGGPFNVRTGRTVKSHHIPGWDDFPLTAWLTEHLGRPAVVANDADTAGLAEALFGAGKDCDPVLYLTVGTGIGGGLIYRGEIYEGFGLGAAEIGHLRPGLQADHPESIVESFAAGWGIAAAGQEALSEPIAHPFRSLASPGSRPRNPEEMRQRLIEAEDSRERDSAELLDLCQGQPSNLTAQHVASAAADGNLMARDILLRAWQNLGWAVAQAVTLTAPEIVVIGGGVSRIGESDFFAPLRAQALRYVFPPYADRLRIVPSLLGETVVLHGSLALARRKFG